MHRIETKRQAAFTTATAEDLRPKQWTRKPVENRSSRTTSPIQRFHTHSHRGRHFLSVHVCDSFETARRTIRCKKSDVNFHQTRICLYRYTDGQRYNFYCRSSETNDGTSRISIKNAQSITHKP